MYYVYVLKSLKDGFYYVGQTNNLERRILRHNLGHGKFTKRSLPYKLAYSEFFKSRTEAMNREREIKSYKGGDAFKKLLNECSL